jgi:hypothetical protein
LRACERIVAESPDRAERRAAAAEISQILRQCSPGPPPRSAVSPRTGGFR